MGRAVHQSLCGGAGFRIFPCSLAFFSSPVVSRSVSVVARGLLRFIPVPPCLPFPLPSGLACQGDSIKCLAEFGLAVETFKTDLQNLTYSMAPEPEPVELEPSEFSMSVPSLETSVVSQVSLDFQQSFRRGAL